MSSPIDYKKIIRINSSSPLAIIDVETVNLLYAPIIKEDAIRLYLTLYGILNRTNFETKIPLHDLLDILMFTEKRFIESKGRLEAIALLNFYESEEEYLIMLKNPLTPKQFLSDGVLGMYLYSLVGEESFKRLNSLFEIPKVDKTKYSELTASFDDYFTTRELPKLDTGEYLVDKKLNQGIKIKNYPFDFEKFKASISENFLDGRRISTKFRKYIVDIAFAYRFNEEDMKMIYNKSLNSSGYFDYSLCSKNARSLYKERHNGKLPEVDSVSVIGDDIKKYAYMLENISPSALLESSTNDKAKEEDITNILNLYLNYQDLPKSVINSCIIHSIKLCKDKAPAYLYYEKVLKDWINKGIDDFSKAYRILTEDQKEYSSKGKKKVDEPDWLKEHWAHFEEGVEDL